MHFREEKFTSQISHDFSEEKNNNLRNFFFNGFDWCVLYPIYNLTKTQVFCTLLQQKNPFFFVKITPVSIKVNHWEMTASGKSKHIDPASQHVVHIKSNACLVLRITELNWVPEDCSESSWSTLNLLVHQSPIGRGFEINTYLSI